MADKQLKPFVLNDENVVNSYGFRVRNAGLSYTRFDANPVMLDSHINKTGSVLGNWKNRRVEGSQTIMDANFDTDDANAAVIEGKVERGFVKGASFGLGISFDSDSFERQPDGVWDLIQAEVMEGSVCGVPSNSASLAFYNINTGELIAEDQFKLSLQNLTIQELKINNNPNMEKITLTPGALSALMGAGVTNAADAVEISRGIETLQTNLAAKTARVTELEGLMTAQTKLQAETLVDAAIKDEKILLADRQEWVDLGISNIPLATKLIAKLPGKVSLNAQVNNTAADPADPKSIDEFVKMPQAKQLAFKNEKPEAYTALFAAVAE